MNYYQKRSGWMPKEKWMNARVRVISTRAPFLCLCSPWLSGFEDYSHHLNINFNFELWTLPTSSSNDSPDLNFILNFQTTSSLWCFIKKAKFLKDLTTTPSNLLNFKTTLSLWCFNKKAKLYNILIREVMIPIINNRNSIG